MARDAKILLLTHGGWGASLVRGLEVILGRIDCVHEIPLEPSHTLLEYREMVEEYLDTASGETLIMVDMLGGTPSNVAAMIGDERGLRVFSGLNAPMLLEACTELKGDGRLDPDAILAAGSSACKDVVEAVRSSMRRGM